MKKQNKSSMFMSEASMSGKETSNSIEKTREFNNEKQDAGEAYSSCDNKTLRVTSNVKKSLSKKSGKNSGSKKPVIPVFFSIDSKYAPFFSVTLSSLLDNASEEYAYRIIVLHQGLRESDKKQLRKVPKSYPGKDVSFDFVPIRRNMSAIVRNMERQSGSLYKTLTIYYRLFIPVMFPEFEKAIYLDSDMVVTDDISKLYNIELGSHLLGAVNDASVYGVKPFAEYIQKALGIELTKYVNSGVLLMNMRGLREVHFHDRFLELMNRYGFDTVAPDQDYINVLCKDRILLLDGRWNTMPLRGVPEKEEVGIVHYNLNNKPWRFDNIPYGEHFWRYAETSPYYRTILRVREQYNEPSRHADEMKIKELLECASRMVSEAFNFRTVYALGLEMPL